MKKIIALCLLISSSISMLDAKPIIRCRCKNGAEVRKEIDWNEDAKAVCKEACKKYGGTSN